MKKINYSLEGSFKVDLFSGGALQSTTDWFSNFITPTGLMYPTGYAFADCFRYLSIGSSNTPSQGSLAQGSFGTTGLTTIIPSYVTSAGTQNGQYIDWRGYASGVQTSNCGTTITETGPRFYRAWYIPTGSDDVTINEGGGGLDIREFMVSPSSGNSPGQYAFSRVTRALYIPNGFRAIVSYQLKINIQNTGLTYLAPASFNTSNAEISNDAAIVARWANLSGYYRQVYFGLRCVDNLGFTYIPKFGDGMEPASRNLSKMVWYLSPDNSQFDVNGLGGPQPTFGKSYQADGLMYHIGRNEMPLDLGNVISQTNYDSMSSDDLAAAYNNTILSPIDNIPDENILPDNIRLGSTSTPLHLPQLDNYQRIQDDSDITNFTYQLKQSSSNGFDTRTISYATPGINQFSTFITDFGKKAAFASNTTKTPFSTGAANSITGRKKTVTRKSTFSPSSSLGYNTRFGSMVYAYEASDITETVGNRQYWPMIDCQFIDSSGKFLLPHYRYVSGIYMTDRGTGILQAAMYLSGIYGGNIYKFGVHRTFQGPYSPSFNHWLTGIYAETLYAPDLVTVIGIGYSGWINSGISSDPNSYGVTGLSIGGTGYTSGWGAVYGLVVDQNFYDIQTPDTVIHSHPASGNITNTGHVFWPYIAPENRVRVYVSGLQYWTPEFSGNIFSDSSLWFNPNQQIIKDINFDRLDASFNPIVSTDYAKNVTGFTGFCLSTGRFNGGIIPINAIVGNSSYAFTGYVVPAARNTAGQLKGTSWVDTAGAMPTDSLSFIPTLSDYVLTSQPGSPTIKRVTSLFNTFTDRGYPNGTGLTPIKSNDVTLMFFTGFSGSSPRSGLYLTYISGNASNQLIAYSYLSGRVSLTDFGAPTGLVLHGEKYGTTFLPRLATNFAPANTGDSNIYTAVTGGEYPALSLDNGLELYLDLSWKSSCGPTTINCVDPS